jgi:hypothetical protein
MPEQTTARIERTDIAYGNYGKGAQFRAIDATTGKCRLFCCAAFLDGGKPMVDIVQDEDLTLAEVAWHIIALQMALRWVAEQMGTAEVANG